MTEKKKLSFKDFQKKQVDENIDYTKVNVPTQPPVLNPSEDDKIPALFASIHHQSEDRPDGYSPADFFWMNHDANAHLPELQKSMRDDRRAEGHTDVQDEEHYTKKD